MEPFRYRPLAGVSLAALSQLAGHAAAQVIHDSSYTLSVELENLANPQGVDIDAAGNVYLADSARGQILKGSGGSFAPLITGIAVSEFFGLDIGPLAIHIAHDQTLWYGEGGRLTGIEQIHRHALDGSPLQSLAPTPDGGNWSGIIVDPLSGRLYASSANRDRVFIADPTTSGYGELQEIINTGSDALTSPTGLLLDDGVLHVGMYGPWNVDGQIAQYDAVTGLLSLAEFSIGMPGLAAIDRLADGRLLAAQVGTEPGQGALWLINPNNGEKTALVTDLAAASGVAVGPDGTTIYLVDMGNPNEQDGRLLKLIVVPAPVSGALLTAGIICSIRRRRA